MTTLASLLQSTLGDAVQGISQAFDETTLTVSADRYLQACEQLRDAPAAALLFSCNMRGTRMFENPHHDAAFCSSRLRGAPIAGFHCAGEIGPALRPGGAHSFVHTQTASLAIFRRAH